MRVCSLILSGFLVGLVRLNAQAPQPELTAAAIDLAFHETGSVTLHGILFDVGKATIKVESAKALASIGEVLQSDAELKLEIRSHTSNAGMPAENLRLSRARSGAVKAYLVDHLGISPERLTAVGLGDTKPAASNADPAGRAANDRIELVKK